MGKNTGLGGMSLGTFTIEHMNLCIAARIATYEQHSPPRSPLACRRECVRLKKEQNRIVVSSNHPSGPGPAPATLEGARRGVAPIPDGIDRIRAGRTWPDRTGPRSSI